jgi:hypothetical protein
MQGCQNQRRERDYLEEEIAPTATSIDRSTDAEIVDAQWDTLLLPHRGIPGQFDGLHST